MTEFSAYLLREKFAIRDPTLSAQEDTQALTAMSNRMVVPLIDKNGETVEIFIVRAHNMHSTIRMAARILYSFRQDGPIMARNSPFDWKEALHSIISNYEYTYNPERWLAVYHKGKCIFSQKQHHPILDVVEKCDFENDRDYDFAMPKAEALLQKTGKTIKIDYDGNVALNAEFKDGQGRCGIILRGTDRTTTFSFSTRPKNENQPLNIPQTLSAAAAFLEGIQLAFLLGFNAEKLRIGLIDRFSKEEKQVREGYAHLKRLDSEISNLEHVFDVRYRPEKPEFNQFLNDATELAEKTLVPPDEQADTLLEDLPVEEKEEETDRI